LCTISSWLAFLIRFYLVDLSIPIPCQSSQKWQFANYANSNLFPLRRLLALVLPVIHQIIHHGRIGQGRGVAEIAEFVLGDLA
jgi:hypothetical protein